MSDGRIKASIVMATRNKAEFLPRTIESIERQDPGFNFEVIVVDDGSSDGTYDFCIDRLIVRYRRLQNDTYRNPSVARNVGYRMARGDVIIAQSDEVIHETPDTIRRLVDDLHQGEFLLATVYNFDWERQQRGIQYVGERHRRPFFFLGSLWRRDLYAVGGSDEEFTAPAYDDDWFGLCLTRGLGLVPRYLPDVIGLHQHHPRPANLPTITAPSGQLFAEKVRRAEADEIPWRASGGPWEFTEE